MANEFLQNIFNATQSIREKQRIQEQKNRDNLLAFFGGVADNYHAYAGGINKGLGKVAKKIGWDSGAKWLNENATLSQLNRQRTQDAMGYGSNPYIGMAGQILGDPINVLPAGTIVKGGKTALKTAKSFGLGAGLGASTSMLRDYNDDSISKADMFKNAMLGGLMWGGANSLLASRAVDTLARKAIGKIAPNAKFADINARNARWAREQAQMNANPTAWYNREVAVPFAQDFRNLQAKFRPQQTTGNQVLDSVLAMTNQPKPQTFSQSIATRPLMGENPNNLSQQALNAKRREMLDNMYNQQMANRYGSGNEIVSGNGGTMGTRTPIPNNVNGFQQIPQRPQIQPINNPQIVNQNMKAGKLNGSAFYDLGAMAGRNLIGTTAGGIGGYAYGGDMDSALAGAIVGTLAQHGGYRGGKYLYNRMPLGDTQNALKNSYATLSYETRMSDKIPQLNQAYEALGNRELANNLDKAINDSKAVHNLLNSLGLKHKDIGVKDGFYEGVSNPSRQVQIKPQYERDMLGRIKKDANGNPILTQDFRAKINLASAMIGKNFKQDSVGWHIPMQIKPEYERNIFGIAKKDINGNKILTQNYKDKLRKANAVSINLGREINANELSNLNKALGDKGYGLIPDPDGQSVRIIDFMGNHLNSDDIINSLNKNGYNIDTKNIVPFKTESDLIAGKWVKNNSVYSKKGYNRQIGEHNDFIFNRGLNRSFGSIGERFSGELGVKRSGEKLQSTYNGRLQEAMSGAGKTLDENSKQFLKKGFITPNLASHIATSGTGALIGASQDSENRLRGATIGAIGGIGANKFIKLGANAFIKNQTDNIAKELSNLAKGNPKLFNEIAEKRLQEGKLNKQVLTQHQRPKHEPLAEQGSAMLTHSANLPQQGKFVNTINNGRYMLPNADRPLMGEMAERNAHLNQIREIFDKQNAKANLGKDYHSDINAVEQGLITPDEFINAWKKPSVADNTAKIADDIPHNGGGNGGDIPPNAPKNSGFTDDGGNEFAKQIGLENLSDNDLKKAFADTPNNNNSVKGFIPQTLAKDAIMASGGAAYGAYNAEDGEKLQGAVGGALGGIALAHPFKTLQLGGKVASKTADTIGNVPGVKQAIQAYDKNVAKATNKADDYWRAFWAKTSDKVRAESNQRFQNMSISEIAKEAQANFKRQNPNVSDDAGMRFATSYAENMVRKDFADISRHIVDDSMSVGQQVKETAYNVSQWFKETLSDTKGASFNVAYDKFIGSKNGFSQKMASLQDTLLKMSESDRTALHNYLVGESEALGTKLPEKYKFMADGIRQSIDDMSDKLVKDGLIDEAVANELKGQYIHRLYDSVGEKAKDTIAKNTNTLEKMHHRGKLVETISKKEWQERLKNSDYNDLFKADFNKGGLRAIEKNGKMEIYRDFTPQERTAMKEIRDAAHTIPQTLMYMNTLAENARFLKELANLGNGEIMTADMIRKHFGMETANIAKLGEKAKISKFELNEAQIKELKRLGYEKVATDPKWGALSGQWVRRDMFDALKGSRFFNMDELGLLGKLWLHGTSFWKKSKTIFSQTAHINNVLSNVSLMHLAGVSKRDITRGYAFGSEAIGAIKRYDEIVAKNRIGKATMSEINELQALNQNEYVKTILQGRQVGLFGRSMLHDINNGIIQPNLQVVKGKGIGGKIKQGWNSVDKWASDLYQDEDNLGRIVMFKHFMDKGMSPQQAKIATQAYIPDYSRVMPKGERWLRDKMIAPFMSWSYYVMPTMAKYIAKHPTQASSKILPLLALAGTAQYALSGINPLKADVVGDDNLKPNEFQGRKLAVGRDGDRIRGYELSRIVPYLNVINPQTWAEYGKGLMSGPTSQFIYNVSNKLAREPLKQLYNGRPVTYQNKSNFDQMKDYLGYGVKTYAPIPQVATNAVDLANSLIFPKERRRTSSVIEPKTTNELIAKFAGFNTTSYNIDRLRRENAKKKQQEREKELKKLRSK